MEENGIMMADISAQTNSDILTDPFIPDSSPENTHLVKETQK